MVVVLASVGNDRGKGVRKGWRRGKKEGVGNGVTPEFFFNYYNAW